MANLPELKERWLALCASHHLQDAESEWLRILRAYEEPHRAYHNLDHIEHCLELLDENDAFAENPTALEFAIWYHDVVYDTQAQDNEERSARAAGAFLVDSVLRDSVSTLILATRHTGEFQQDDFGIISDIDLAILGATPQAYDDYAANIRREYAWVEPATYASKRSQLLKRFLEHGVYTSVIFDEDHEHQARANLQREIESLTAL